MEKENMILKKRPVLKGKSVKINFKLTQIGLNAFNFLKKKKRFSSNSEVFDLIYSVTASLKEDDDLFKAVLDKSEKEKIRKTFSLNSYTLAGFKKLSRKHDTSVDNLIEGTACLIQGLLNHLENKDKKFDSKKEALASIDVLWSQFSDLSMKLENTFPSSLDDDLDDPGSVSYHLASIEGRFNDLYFLVEEMDF